MVKEMICIICPMSCHLQIQLDEEGKVTNVTGNSCPRGEQYARSEMTNPVRMVTSTVKIKNGLYPRLPVILSGSIPKEKMFQVMEVINQIEVEAPVVMNQVLMENVQQLGVNVIASRSMKIKE
jgi:CxxC motif-containing protein